ncbi:MAG: hypothetical protein BroJett040_13740 [Oligoflexia bacterium]|nr:MAG: hypothetical protein BroJett040_13740 [Oligoflexia bacterium]
MRHLALYILFLLLTSCVSVNVNPSKVTRAKDVEFIAPSSPFHSIQNNSVDQAWQSKNTGNTIAYLSECGGSDISLKQMETESLSAISQPNILESKTGTYNDRESLESLAAGKVDGIEIKMKLILFKKNNCNYTISYIGRKDPFSAEENYFQKFISGFKAP